MTFKSILFPEKEFSSQEELFQELKNKEKELIEAKKNQIYKSHEKGQISAINLDASKISGALKEIGFDAKDDHIYPIISTTNYFDSHKDVHFNGSMTKTAKEQQGKVSYALDHELKYNSILAFPKYVKMFIAEIPWGLVGKSYEGKTQALIFGIAKENIRNQNVLKDIEEKNAEFENSIRMRYFKIFMGINSSSKQYVLNKQYYDKHINSIVNKKDVAKDGYFFGVEELGIWKEGSLVVAGGSNDATAIYSKTNDTENTQEEEPPKNTPKKLEPSKVLEVIKNHKFNF